MIKYEVIVYHDGHQIWRLNGKVHREDGPAIITKDGTQFWYLNNEHLTEEDHKERMNPTKELSMAELESLLGYKVKIVKESK